MIALCQELNLQNSNLFYSYETNKKFFMSQFIQNFHEANSWPLKNLNVPSSWYLKCIVAFNSLRKKFVPFFWRMKELWYERSDG